MDRVLFEKCRTAQEKLVELTTGQDGVVGVGIGVTADRSGPELEVMIESEAAAPDIPDEIEGVPVRLHVVGNVRAY